MTRRIVRVNGDFFDQLDRQLPAERGAHGEPSVADFIHIDLPVVIERFASGFDELPEAVPGVPTARVVVGAGKVVRYFVVVVYGLLLDDNLALAGCPEGTRLEVVVEPTGPAWLPIAVFFNARGHVVHRVSRPRRTICAGSCRGTPTIAAYLGILLATALATATITAHLETRHPPTDQLKAPK